MRLSPRSETPLVCVQEQKWGGDKGLKKIFGMLKAAKSNSLTFHGWAQTHVVNILWGGSSKLISAMRHDQLCGFFAVDASSMTRNGETTAMQHIVPPA
jgi:hypothetical protein